MKPLLRVAGLTVRFKGLTAVDQVDLTVNEGQIVSVIGPNGAGKTSLFNAITGIYEPAEGTVELDGKDLQSTLGRRDIVRAALTALGVGLFFSLWVCDVNQMWSAVVKTNTKDGGRGFAVGQAAEDLGAFLLAKPWIDFRAGRYYVTTGEGQTPFGSARSREEAIAKREVIDEMAQLQGTGTIEIRGDKAVILSEDRARVLDEAPNEVVAQARIASAKTVASDRRGSLALRLTVLVIGAALGFAGAIAVWRQSRRTPTSVAQRGIARTFQNIRLFQEMSALENVLVGMDRHLEVKGSILSRKRLVDVWPYVALGVVWLVAVLVLRFQVGVGPSTVGLVAFLLGVVALNVSLVRRGTFSPSATKIEADGRAQAIELLELVGLAERAEETAKNLPYGAQRRLEIARALASRPRLLLLDEPAAGMNPRESHELTHLVRKIRDRGVTVLLIEHHMRVVMGISDHIAVLVYGKKIAEGTPDEIRENPAVIEAYLGKEEVG